MNPRSLHITNGDSAADTMAEAGIPGRILPWRDILHDGPVPGDLSLDQLAEIRADFLQHPPVASRDQVLQGFRERDEILQTFREYDVVTIWLEHDLYDQLQLLQLLHWFSGVELGQTSLRLICIDRFPGVVPFYGLGQLDPQQMGSLQGSEQTVSREQIELGRRGWLAFTANTPVPLLEFLNDDLSALPFLAPALNRHLEEFPDSNSGLSRHQRQILEMVEAGIQHPGRLFAEHQEREAAPYLGDWSFWSLIENLTNVSNAVLKTDTGKPFKYPPFVPADESFRGQALQITELGQAVLQRKADWIALNPPDYWKGGVHLHPDETVWRWDSDKQTVLASGT